MEIKTDLHQIIVEQDSYRIDIETFSNRILVILNAIIYYYYLKPIRKHSELKFL